MWTHNTLNRSRQRIFQGHLRFNVIYSNKEICSQSSVDTAHRDLNGIQQYMKENFQTGAIIFEYL